MCSKNQMLHMKQKIGLGKITFLLLVVTAIVMGGLSITTSLSSMNYDQPHGLDKHRLDSDKNYLNNSIESVDYDFTSNTLTICLKNNEVRIEPYLNYTNVINERGGWNKYRKVIYENVSIEENMAVEMRINLIGLPYIYNSTKREFEAGHIRVLDWCYYEL